jgi:hypothetical protein
MKSAAVATWMVGSIGIAHGYCPGQNGDAMCKNIAGGSSICVPGVYVCKGTTTNCGCDFSAPVPTGTKTPVPTTRIASTTAAPAVAKPTSSPTTFAPTTVAPSALSTSEGTCGTSPTTPLFLWAEWPTLSGPSDWKTYFAKLLSFMGSNCGNFDVVKLIMRVNVPTVVGLWTFSTQSAFYTEFLSRLPSNVELHMYPYLWEAGSRASWQSDSSGLPALESAFNYARKWNSLGGHRIVGIVVDGEEKSGFEAELGNIAAYKTKYGISTFGMAIGYDQPGAIKAYPQIDEFYLEMYDFYVNGASALSLVETTKATKVDALVKTLSANVLDPYIASYSDPRFVFMWSVQARSPTDCIYPLSNSCGLKDDFGLITAPAFNKFLRLITDRYPVFSGRQHGLFQFSFIPHHWF